jgi:hypothetical protein
MKRAGESPSAALSPRERQAIDLLAQLRSELVRQWELSVRPIPVDDDLMPAQQQIENALVEVNLALERARTGQYGRCSACGNRIDLERLLAHPAATTCWPCQEAAEDKRRGEVHH